MPRQFSLAKESLEIIFNFSVSSSVLFILVLPPILIVWAAYFFVFGGSEHLSVGRFWFVLRVGSPSASRLPVAIL